MASRSLDQERAAYAWDRVKDGISSDQSNLAKGAPALIMSNGLMQTLAFYQSKGNKHHKWLLEAIAGWLQQRFPNQVKSRGFDQVMKALHGGSADFYLQATDETLELLRWLRQLAAAKDSGGSR